MTDDVYNTWVSELNNLLIFASLFSAILTAFTVEASKAIKVDFAEEMALLLRTLVLQVNNLSNSQPSFPINLDSVRSTPPSHAQQIYLLYSVSLTLSLISVLGGITCSQWLREFSKTATGVSHKTDIYLHYQRHASLRKWGVIAFLNALPILLLVSLFLFFAGFLTSQWESNTLAATPVTVLISIAVLFIIATSFIPTLQVLWLANYNKHELGLLDPSDEQQPPLLCPYRSPQSWLIHTIISYILRSLQWISFGKLNSPCFVPFVEIGSWTRKDIWWTDKHMTMKSIYPALHWVATELKQSKDAIFTVHKCFIEAITDTCCEHLSRFWFYDRRVPNTAWTAYGFPTMLDFERVFVTDKSIVISKMHLEAFSRIWDVMTENNLMVNNTSSCDIYKILHVESRWHANNMLRSIMNSLANQKSATPMTYTQKGALVTATCHVLDLYVDSWKGTISILVELCKEKENHSLIHQLCNKLQERLSSRQYHKGLLRIFNNVFPHVDPASGIGAAVGRLLVQGEGRYISSDQAKDFLAIIERLASQNLIGKEHSLEHIFFHTTHVLERSWDLHEILPCIESTLNSILSAAENYVQTQLLDPSASTHLGLDPGRFVISHNVAPWETHRDSLKPVNKLFDMFNERWKEIWDKRVYGEVVSDDSVRRRKSEDRKGLSFRKTMTMSQDVNITASSEVRS